MQDVHDSGRTLEETYFAIKIGFCTKKLILGHKSRLNFLNVLRLVFPMNSKLGEDSLPYHNRWRNKNNHVPELNIL